MKKFKIGNLLFERREVWWDDFGWEKERLNDCIENWNVGG